MDISSLSPWIQVRVSRSPGPGGQNVNKVNTRVTLLLDVTSCETLSKAQKMRIRKRLRTRISRDGQLRVVSSRHRTQYRNRVAAEKRLIELLTEATRQQKLRRATRPTAASRKRRLASERMHSEVKRQRGAVPDD